MDVKINACCTTWGWAGSAASSQGLLGVTLPTISRKEALAPLLSWWPAAREGMSATLSALNEKLCCYFMGEAVDFRDQTLDLRQATDFQACVWAVVRSIPRGQVRSYSWVAAQVGSPRAARAVGRVMARNPLPIVVPCHRVVGQDGKLTGFAGGLDMKRRLLELETCTQMLRRF
jgi:O-6-methylguanine DNA methyltransferase